MFFTLYIYICIETGEQFTSANLAGKAIGISKGCIVKACIQENRTAGGYHWQKIPHNK